MRKTIVVCAVVALLALASGAFSHELVMKPMQMSAAPGETVALEIHSTHVFIVPEETENVDVMTAGVFTGGKVVPVELRANEPELRIDAEFAVPHEGAVILVCDRLPAPRAITNEGRKSGTRKELEAQGLNVVSVTKTDKFAKAIVNATAGDTNFAEPAGQELEIVPVTNPAEVKPGDFMEFRALFQGRPVAGPVWATYDGFSPDNDTYAYYTDHSVEGVFRVKITEPGLWIVRTMRREEGRSEDYDSRTLISVLTFEIK